MKSKIINELDDLNQSQLEKVLNYIGTIKAEQPSLFFTDDKCRVCGTMLYKPARGPMPKFCSPAHRQKFYRLTKALAEWQTFINN